MTTSEREAMQRMARERDHARADKLDAERERDLALKQNRRLRAEARSARWYAVFGAQLVASEAEGIIAKMKDAETVADKADAAWAEVIRS